MHGKGFRTFAAARAERFARFEELRRRWDEEHAKLRELMLMYKNKAAYNSDMASRYQAAATRLERFEQAGPPQAVPLRQQVSMRLAGGRTGRRAVVVERLELTGLMKPFDTEIWFGDRVAVLAHKHVVINDTLQQVEQFDDPWVQAYFHGPRGRAASRAAAHPSPFAENP